MTPKTHSKIISALESHTKRKLICVPRGTFKSSICSISFPIWLLISNPNLRILIDSEVYTNSKNFLREIKAHLVNEDLIRLFGTFYNSSNWNEGEITISQRKVNKKEASITCSGLGAVKVGQHFDVIIGDDYNSPLNSGTPEGRRKVVDHFKMNMSILEPDGIYVIVGTRYSEDDLIGWIMKNLIEGNNARSTI